MEFLGVALTTILLFVAFGSMVGVIFGFFGMGSFLVTPALLVMGYDSRIVVGSGLAFVFGTAVTGTLRHRDLGQVDYRLGIFLIAGTVLGIEIGKRAVLVLESVGLAGFVVGITYVLLLSVIGGMVIMDAWGYSIEISYDFSGEWGNLKANLWHTGPELSLRDGDSVSYIAIGTVAVIAGVLSGFLGVGGGFLRMPALTYLFGLSLPVAVGTNIFAVMFAGAFGSFTWAQVGGVDLSIVTPLLVGSALGARIGSALTRLVDEDAMKSSFGFLLVAAAIAVSLRQIADLVGIDALRVISLGLLVSVALLVSGRVVYSGIAALRSPREAGVVRAD